MHAVHESPLEVLRRAGRSRAEQGQDVGERILKQCKAIVMHGVHDLRDCACLGLPTPPALRTLS